MKPDRQTELFLRRVAIRIADTGAEPTPENIEAAMRRTVERDEEIFVELYRFGGRPMELVKDVLCRDIYETIRRTK